MIKKSIVDEMYCAILEYKETPDSLDRYSKMFSAARKIEPDVMNKIAPSYDASPHYASLVRGDVPLYRLVEEFGGAAGLDGLVHIPGDPKGMKPATVALWLGNLSLATEIMTNEVCALSGIPLKRKGPSCGCGND